MHKLYRSILTKIQSNKIYSLDPIWFHPKSSNGHYEFTSVTSTSLTKPESNGCFQPATKISDTCMFEISVMIKYSFWLCLIDDNMSANMYVISAITLYS